MKSVRTDSPARGAPLRMSRRRFLRALGVASTAGGGTFVAGCDRATRETGSGGDEDATPITRPLLRPWADDIVWMADPSRELPVAYVSMERRQVFVDYDFRDRASWLLGAHISVSTALWRIPLPGDPPGQPVTPGDEAREFEELPMREWDASLTPAMDDIRVLRGRPVSRRVQLDCVPLLGTSDSWLSAGPWEIQLSSGEATDSVREDFGVVGTGLLHPERVCAGRGEAVQLLSWAHRTL